MQGRGAEVIRRADKHKIQKVTRLAARVQTWKTDKDDGQHLSATRCAYVGSLATVVVEAYAQ